MANKLFAVFLVCMVVAAAFTVQASKDDDEYKACFKSCDEKCTGEGLGSTLCEMRCDSDCAQKIIAAELDIKLH